MALQPDRPVDWLSARETVPVSRPTHHTVVGIDVACSGGRNDLLQLRMRADLRAVIAAALANQGLAWIHLHHDDLGDGVRLIVPAGISPSVMLDPFVPAIAQLLRGHRMATADTARLRLRIAVHMGLLHHDGHGWAGQPLVHAARLLNAASVRLAFETAPQADLILVVSQLVYESVVEQGYGLDPETYRSVQICEKETDATAWIHLPAVPPLAIEAAAGSSLRRSDRR